MSDPRGPKAGVPGAATRRAAVTELVELLANNLPNLTSRPDDLPRAFAVAALARATRLLEGIEAHRAAGLADLASLGLRPLYETVVCSLYCLLGGDDAVAHVRGAYVREMNLLSADITDFTNSAAISDAWTGPLDRISWEDLGRSIGDMIADGFPHEANAREVMQTLYDGIYRGESIHSSHGGVGSFAGHLFRDGEVVGVARDRYAPDDGTGALLMAAVLVALNAHFVYRRTGVAVFALDAIAERIRGGNLDLIVEVATP